MRVTVVFASLCIFLCMSCTTVKEIEQKKEAGDYIADLYDFNWDAVYDATKFVLMHSESDHIKNTAGELGGCRIDYAVEEKTMWFWMTEYPAPDCVAMAIFFEPRGESKTRVLFVQGGTFCGTEMETTIHRLMDETHFYLENGKAAYLKYTHDKHVQRVEEYRMRLGWE